MMEMQARPIPGRKGPTAGDHGATGPACATHRQNAVIHLEMPTEPVPPPAPPLLGIVKGSRLPSIGVSPTTTLRTASTRECPHETTATKTGSRGRTRHERSPLSGTSADSPDNAPANDPPRASCVLDGPPSSRNTGRSALHTQDNVGAQATARRPTVP